MKRRTLTSEEKSTVKNFVRQYIVANGLTNEKVAKLVREKYPNANDNGANLALKLNNGTIKLIEFLEIIDALDYDLKIEKRK